MVHLVVWLHIFVSNSTDQFLALLYRDWRWSWKVPSRVQVLKFSPENIATYAAFAVGVQHLDWSKLKFLDALQVIHLEFPRYV